MDFGPGRHDLNASISVRNQMRHLTTLIVLAIHVACAHGSSMVDNAQSNTGNDPNTYSRLLQISNDTSSPPTPAPIAAPQPTPAPLPLPTEAPVAAPTAAPSRAPTTTAPTLAPQSTSPTSSPIHPPTSEPTVSPISAPTQTPVASPTTDPSPIPTPPPTGKPAIVPTRLPTFSPIALPTHSPTSSPVYTPTLQPSFTPTASPTFSPVHPPTSIPAAFPSRHPTGTPIAAPTPFPTRIPTSAPSRRQTRQPTRPPTRAPVTLAPIAPTLAPVLQQTRTPTPWPTMAPTFAPFPLGGITTLPPSPSPTPATTNPPTRLITRFPTMGPTLAPTSRPTLVPTKVPTHEPTSRPSNSPSAMPSNQPTMDPTVSAAPSESMAPSDAPSPEWQFPKFEAFVRGSQLLYSLNRRRLQSAPPTAVECRNIWREFVEGRIRLNVEKLVNNIELLEVSVENVTVDILPESQRAAYMFDTYISLRSPIPDHDTNRLIGGAFDSVTERNEMRFFLQDSNCAAFSFISDVEYVFPPGAQTFPDLQQSSDSGANPGLVAGLVITSLAALAVVGLVVYRKRTSSIPPEKSYDRGEDQDIISIPNEYGSVTPLNNAEQFENILRGTRTDNEVSTLGDPIPHGMAAVSEDISTIGNSYNYDFQKEVRQHQQSESEASDGVSGLLSGSKSNMTDVVTLSSNILVADDDTFDRQYISEQALEVIAPAGKVGLILETARDGTPVVNSINPGSVLEDQVQVGDRLVSVDGLDVTVLSASEVSKLIAAKRNQDERKLLFVRSSGNT